MRASSFASLTLPLWVSMRNRALRGQDASGASLFMAAVVLPEPQGATMMFI